MELASPTDATHASLSAQGRPPTLELIRFTDITLWVQDLAAAASDWAHLVGQSPGGLTDDSARLTLGDGTRILLRTATSEPGCHAGMTSVAVQVASGAHAAGCLAEWAVGHTTHSDGNVVVVASDLNGVSMALTTTAVALPDADPGPPAGTFESVSHVVVAVRHQLSAVSRWTGLFGASDVALGAESAHHVPVGRSWFGITDAGTDAGALSRFVDRRGEGIYAVGLTVRDLAATVRRLRADGVRLIESTQSHQVFIHPAATHGLLVDLVALPREATPVGRPAH